MARYKYIDTNPRFLAVDLAKQLLPGTFEHALHHLLDGAIDLSNFDARFRNDATGAPAYPPAMLLRVVLFAYSQGIVSSRGIERACQDHVTFIALCGDTAPHFTTIAHFISTLDDTIAKVLAAVLAVCDRQGLIGHEMFAIDGVKLPSNASKHRSGTRADFEKQAAKLEAAATAMLARHREADGLPVEPDLAAKAKARVAKLERDAKQMREWLATHPSDRPGARGAIRQSNRTDNASAKMATSKGVIQGDTGVAAVDAQHQIMVEAQAHGTGSEQEVLRPVVTAPTRPCPRCFSPTRSRMMRRRARAVARPASRAIARARISRRTASCRRHFVERSAIVHRARYARSVCGHRTPRRYGTSRLFAGRPIRRRSIRPR